MITSIKINKFKTIENETIDLNRFNILIGANNSGKSSVLQAIQFAVGAAQTARKNARSLEGEFIKYSANASSFTYLPIKDIEALVHNRNLTQTQGCTIKLVEDDDFSEIEFKRGKNRNIATTINNSTLSRKIMSEQPYCVYTPGISGISISEEFKSKAVVLKSATRGDSNFYLRNILLLLKRQDKEWQNFIEAFELFFPDYTLNVLFDENADETIDSFVELKNGTKLPIDALGTSALQILQILSYVFYFNPQILILDEPDTHLHPNNQRLLITTLNEISKEKEMQVLIATHSRHIIDEASNFAQFLWMQNGKLIKIFDNTSTSEFFQMIMDLGAFDKSEVFFNKEIKWIVFTEDAKCEKELMLKSILVSSGFNEKEFVILPYQGCSKIDSVILLHDFIRSFSYSLKIILHRDRDYLSDDEIQNLHIRLAEKDIFLWVPDGTDVESVFANVNHIKSIFPDLDEKEITDIIDNSILASREKSLDKFVNYVANKKESRNYRCINQECERLYDGNPNRYFYGKKVIGNIKSELQKRLGINDPKIFKPSQYIKQENLYNLLPKE